MAPLWVRVPCRHTLYRQSCPGDRFILLSCCCFPVGVGSGLELGAVLRCPSEIYNLDRVIHGHSYETCTVIPWPNLRITNKTHAVLTPWQCSIRAALGRIQQSYVTYPFSHSYLFCGVNASFPALIKVDCVFNPARAPLQCPYSRTYTILKPPMC